MRARLIRNVPMTRCTMVSSRIEGDVDLNIAADGSIFFDAGPDVSVAGQFSESGEVFTLQVSGNFVEGDRNDDFMEIGIGVRK